MEGGYRYQGLVGPQVPYPISYGYLRVQQWVEIGGSIGVRG